MAGVLDKQVLLYRVNKCCNISLCDTCQGTFYMIYVLELIAVKEDVVCLPSESTIGFSKSFLRTGL